MDDDRFSRQRRLPEVGEIGQARLLAAELALPRGAGADVERAYLEGAGSRVVPSPAAAAPFAHADAFRHPAARDVAAGAWRALRQIRRVLEAK